MAARSRALWSRSSEWKLKSLRPAWLGELLPLHAFELHLIVQAEIRPDDPIDPAALGHLQAHAVGIDVIFPDILVGGELRVIDSAAQPPDGLSLEIGEMLKAVSRVGQHHGAVGHEYQAARR
jgi:hypothetical protein